MHTMSKMTGSGQNFNNNLRMFLNFSSNNFDPEASSFTPMSILNKDSEPDASPITGNVGPIGSGSPKRIYCPLQESYLGQSFSSEVKGTTRYVRIDNVPQCLAHNYLDLGDALHVSHLLGGVESTCFVPQSVGLVSYYVQFFDLRIAENYLQQLTVSPVRVSGHFVDFSEYGQHATNPRCATVTAYDGQVQFSVSYQTPITTFGPKDQERDAVTYASKFGSIRAMAQMADAPQPAFRVEYYNVKDAERVCAAGGYNNGYHSITATPYHPIGFSTCQSTAGHGYRSQATEQISRNGGHFTDPSRVLRDQTPVFHYIGPSPAWRRLESSGMRDSMDHNVVNATPRNEGWNQPQKVVLNDIRRGIDCRTTVMVRNIPNRVNAAEFKAWLDYTSRGRYDFAYLRIDFTKASNVGYAFVNFIRPDAICDLCEVRIGRPWGLHNSGKLCEISYATIQGQDCLISKFRNSSVMREYSAYRPKLFYDEDHANIPPSAQIGDEAPFPPPNNISKLNRSLDNARAVGLFNSYQRGRGRGGHNQGNRTQWDRGTPRALLEEHNFGFQSTFAPSYPSTGGLDSYGGDFGHQRRGHRGRRVPHQPLGQY